MNIIKLKDVIMPSEFRMSAFFNSKLKGRYAYWVQMRYIFPLDSLDYKTYIEYEQYDPADFLSANTLQHIDLYNEEYCMIDFAQQFIDLNATEKANAVDVYSSANKYATDADITITQVKMFRSWLAGELITLNNNYTAEQLHMLEFYKNNMYNDVIKYLDLFNSNTTSYSLHTVSSSCDCCSSNIKSYENSSINSCNPKEIYIKNIHKLMVDTFSDPMFWLGLNIEFLKRFKLYIDNIIVSGLNLVTTKNQKKFTICNCDITDETKNTSILNALSISLGYMIENDGVGHMLYIHDSLYDWAEYLYDYMFWDIK